MGRTRRSGPRPQLHRTEMDEQTLDKFHQLKRSRNEPLYQVYRRAAQALEEKSGLESDLKTAREGNMKIQKRLTQYSMALEALIAYYHNKGQSIPVDDIPDLPMDIYNEIKKSNEKNQELKALV